MSRHVAQPLQAATERPPQAVFDAAVAIARAAAAKHVAAQGATQPPSEKTR